MIARLVLVVAVAALAACAPKPEVAQVLDGNTLQIKGKVIRLHGVEAPQLAQRCGSGGPQAWKCGAAAREELIRLVGDDPVHCDILSRDNLNRGVARCTAGDRDLGLGLVAAGLARLDPTHPAEYATAEAAARQAERGLWGVAAHAAAPTPTPAGQTN